MPQLPSGRHFGIDVAPFHEILGKWHDPEVLDVLTGIRAARDLFPFTRVLELLPDETARGKALPVAAGSTGRPPTGLLPTDTGLRLSNWPDAFADWPAADTLAFQAFVDERAIAFLESALESARAKLDESLSAFGTQVEAAWMQAGVHPSQDLGWDDMPRDFDLDEYDALAALGQCCGAVARSPVPAPSRTNAVVRLEGFWAFARSELPWLPAAPDPLQPTTELARMLRDGAWFARLPVARRSWWRAQLACECENLFNDETSGRLLMQHAPQGWGVVRIVALMTAAGLAARPGRT